MPRVFCYANKNWQKDISERCFKFHYAPQRVFVENIFKQATHIPDWNIINNPRMKCIPDGNPIFSLYCTRTLQKYIKVFLYLYMAIIEISISLHEYCFAHRIFALYRYSFHYINLWICIFVIQIRWWCTLFILFFF